MLPEQEPVAHVFTSDVDWSRYDNIDRRPYYEVFDDYVEQVLARKRQAAAVQAQPQPLITRYVQPGSWSFLPIGGTTERITPPELITGPLPELEPEPKARLAYSYTWPAPVAPAWGNPFELEVVPAQLDMTREVQLQAAMPAQEPEPQKAIAPSTEGIDASLIYAAQNDRTVFEPVALQELAESIERSGLLQPITVRPMPDGRYELVAGERRFRAMTQCLGWSTIPANYVQVKTLTDIEASRLMFIENAKRKDLNPIDEANAYQKRMTQFGLSVQAVARDASFPVERVRARLALLSLTPDAQNLLRSGNLSVGYGELMADLDANRQATALQYFQQAKRPNLAEFRELCGRLLSEQAQDTMFDLADFMAESAAGYAAELASKQTRTERFPTNPRLPAMPAARSVALALEKYIALLLTSDDPDVAGAVATVGTVYSGLIQRGLATPPKASESPLTVSQEAVAA